MPSAAGALGRRQGTTARCQGPRDGSCQLQGGLGSYFSLLPAATFLGFHSHRGRVLILNHHRRPQRRPYTGRCLSACRVPRGRSFLADAPVTTGAGRRRARRSASRGNEAVPRSGGSSGRGTSTTAAPPSPPSLAAGGPRGPRSPPAGSPPRPAHRPRPRPLALRPLPAPAAPGARSRAWGLGIPPPGPQHGAISRGPAVHQVPAARLQPALLGESRSPEGRAG